LKRDSRACAAAVQLIHSTAAFPTRTSIHGAPSAGVERHTRPVASHAIAQDAPAHTKDAPSAITGQTGSPLAVAAASRRTVYFLGFDPAPLLLPLPAPPLPCCRALISLSAAARAAVFTCARGACRFARSTSMDAPSTGFCTVFTARLLVRLFSCSSWPLRCNRL